MKLPNRGLLVTADGVITWAWDWNSTPQEFDALPPFRFHEDGSYKSMAAPSDVVVDLDKEGLESADVQDLVRNLDTARVQLHQNGQFTVQRVMPDGSRIDHPIMAILQYRRRNKK